MSALRAMVLALLALCLAAPAMAQTAPARGVPVRAIASPQGIEAWLVSDSTVPIIVMRVYWHGGSAMEPAGMTGVTALMADMLTEGAGAYDANAFKERLEELNMSLGFSAGWDGLGMSLTTLSEKRDAAFEMARLALAAPRFDAEPMARIKRQWQVSIRARETNPSYIANRAMDEALYPDHPYARQTTAESVEAITRQALAARARAILTRGDADITIVGDISAEEAGRLLDAVFAALPGASAHAHPPDAALNPPTPLIVRELPRPQSLILFSAPGIQDEDPDWAALIVANYILGGGGFSSRLMDSLREQRGLVYGVGTSPSVREHSQFIRGSAQTSNEHAGQALELIRAELARFHDAGAAQTEVDDAITYLTGSFALDLDSNVKIASAVHGYQAAGYDIDYINRRNDLIRAVTRADVNRVAQRLFSPENFTFVVVGQPQGLAAPR